MTPKAADAASNWISQKSKIKCRRKNIFLRKVKIGHSENQVKNHHHHIPKMCTHHEDGTIPCIQKLVFPFLFRLLRA